MACPHCLRWSSRWSSGQASHGSPTLDQGQKQSTSRGGDSLSLSKSSSTCFLSVARKKPSKQSKMSKKMASFRQASPLETTGCCSTPRMRCYPLVPTPWLMDVASGSKTFKASLFPCKGSLPQVFAMNLSRAAASYQKKSSRTL